MNTKYQEKRSELPSRAKTIGRDIVVNYHLTESCNYHCHYCYAKWQVQDSKIELCNDIGEVKNLFNQINTLFRYKLPDEYPDDFGHWSSIRLNLVGGEPTLSKNFGQIVTVARQIGFKIGIVTNGSYLDEEFVLQIANRISIIGISIDAIRNDLMAIIGRSTSSGKVLDLYSLITNLNLLRNLNSRVKIKINTVVNKYNHDQNISRFINRLAPDKWKIFKALPNIEPECEISDMQFYDFLDIHNKFSSIMFPEDNDLMTGSYIMIDPFGRFFDNTCRDGEKGYRYSEPITRVGAYNAFHEINVNMGKFMSRY
jgi:radical S-adenosyl methionine domain-containing protein 2